MNPQETFDSYLERIVRTSNGKNNYGRRLNLRKDTTVDANLRPFYRYVLYQARVGAKYIATLPSTTGEFAPHFFVTDNPNVNAFAVTYRGHDFVGIFKGAIIVPQRLFLRLYSYPDVDIHIGNAGGETAPSPLVHLPTTIGQITDRVSPEDNLRRRVAIHNELWGVLRILIAHEFAHIYLGHTMYAEQHALGGPLMVNRKKVVQNPLIRQAFEVAADAFAVNMLIDTEIRDSQKQVDDFDTEDLVRLQGILKSFYFFLRLFYEDEMENWDLDKLDQQPYPYAPIRFHWAFQSMMSNLMVKRGLQPTLGTDVELLFERVIGGSEKLISKLLGKSDAEVLEHTDHLIFDPKTRDHLDRVEHTMQQAQPELEKYSRSAATFIF